MKETEEFEMDGYVSSDGNWAALPFGDKYMSIYRGQQICVHHTLETAKKFIQRENRKRK